MVGKIKKGMKEMRRIVKSVAMMALLCCCGCGEEPTEPCTVECQNYDDIALDKIRQYVADCLPPKVTDIYVNYRPGCFLGGTYKFVRCKISKDDLQSFISAQQLEFRFDSTQENANKKEKGEIAKTWPNAEGDGMLGFIPDNKENWLNTYADVDEYWSYNFIYTNNGGYRMFYDVRRQLFYAEWSSN